MTILTNDIQLLGIERPISIAPIQQLRDVVLNQNFQAVIPQYANKTAKVLSRVINVAVDTSAPAIDRTITYKSAWGETLTWVANASGFHPLVMAGIISAGVAIESLQWGV
jgi:hypothetical protein